MDSYQTRRGSDSQKADIVREVAWIYSYRFSQNADKGGEGVKNPENFADVLYEWSLMMCNTLSATKAGKG